jgi:hypothetical protein
VARSAQRTAALYRDCRWKVDIRGAIEAKRAALAAHESQVSRMGAGWHVLSDVDGGEFLERLMRPVELFCVREGLSRRRYSSAE